MSGPNFLQWRNIWHDNQHKGPCIGYHRQEDLIGKWTKNIWKCRWNSILNRHVHVRIVQKWQKFYYCQKWPTAFSAPEPKAHVHYCGHALSVLPLLTFQIFDFSKTADQNSRKLHRKWDLNVLYQVCLFRADRKTKMAARPLMWWDILDISSETAEQNWKKLDWKPDLSVIYQVFIFWKNQYAALSNVNKGGALYSGARYVALWAPCFTSYLFSFLAVLIGSRHSNMHDTLTCIQTTQNFIWCNKYLGV